MKDATLIATVALAVAMALIGLAVGWAYFRALRRTVELFAAGRDWRAAAALGFVRIAGAVVVLALMARLGAIALLSGFVGFLLARMIVLRATRETG